MKMTCRDGIGGELILCTIVALSCASADANAAEVRLRDYLPRDQGDIWIFRESGQRQRGNNVIRTWDFERADLVNGIENVNDYGPSCEISPCQGYKYFEGEQGFSDYRVERFTSGGGLELLEEVDRNALSGFVDSYSLFGPTSGSPTLKPPLTAPSSFLDTNGMFSTSYKTYQFDSSGNQQLVINRTQSFSSQGFESVSVPGGTFTALRVSFLETQAAANGSFTTQRSGNLYLTEGLGLVKQHYTSTTATGGDTTTETNTIQLTKAMVGGFKYGKPEYPLVLIHGIDGSGEEAYLEGAKQKTGTWATLEPYLRGLGWQDGGTINVYMNDQNVASLTASDVDTPSAPGDYYTVNFVRTGSNYMDPGSTESPGNEDAIVKQGKGLALAVDKILNVTGSDRVILVGYSMGGLAARDFLEGSLYHGQVAQLVTIGTPHDGSFAVRLLTEREAGRLTLGQLEQGLRPYYGGLSGPAAFLNTLLATGKDINGNAMRDLRDDSIYLTGGDELGTPGGFESADVNSDGDVLDHVVGLNERTLPGGVNYVSLYSQFFAASGLVQIANDGVATADSQKHPGSSGRHLEMMPGCGVRHDKEPLDVADILQGLGYRAMGVCTKSPIDLIITDPLGHQIDKDTQNVFGVLYVENDFDEDGVSEPWVTLLNPLSGTYGIRVIPRPGALPTETYTLGVGYNDRFLLLADGVPIQDVPSEPYTFETADFQPAVPEPGSFTLLGLGLLSPLVTLRMPSLKRRPSTR